MTDVGAAHIGYAPGGVCAAIAQPEFAVDDLDDFQASYDMETALAKRRQN